MPPPQQPVLPNAVDEAYALWIWLDLRTRDFPTAARHSVGARLLDACFDLMEHLCEATYARRGSSLRAQALTAANVKLALLRLLVRGCHEQRYLSLSQYEHVSQRLVAVGRMVGAWLKQAGDGGA